LRTVVTALASLAALAALPAAASAQGGGGPGPPSGQPAPPQPEPPPELVVEEPRGKPLIYEGQTERQLLGGTWYFRQDDLLTQGDTERWYAQTDLNGWTAIKVPHNWNGRDTELDKSSVGWYRKEFTLPKVPKDELKRTFWKVRFEGVNYRSQVWLNGREIGVYTGYFPFEVKLDGLRKGRNTLVVKVSSLRSSRDLTHWRPAAFNGFGTGGWWNFGGLLREVYVRKIDTVDIENVHVLPRLPKLGGAAKVEVRAYLRNMTKKAREVDLVLAVDGQRIVIQGKRIPADSTRILDETITIKRPKLWQPGHPTLYPMTVAANEDGEQRAVYRLRFGVRKLDTAPGGVIMLNGHRLNVRGASIHEDDRRQGGALSEGTRRLMISRLRDLGATVTRSHYPLHPAFIEALDKYGILYWVDAPVYQVPNAYFNESAVRAAARRAVELTVRNNLNHASIMTWSLANEPAGNRSELGIVGTGLARFIEDGAKLVRSLDDTRFVSIDRQSRVGEPPTSSVYRWLDVLGINEYFGWYDSFKADLVRPPTTTSELGPYLDQVHAANPNLPLMITEFGAEGVRTGPVSQPGTYEYQRKFVVDHLRIHASKPFVAGSIHWALRDFRVDPTWLGGAPAEWSSPPWNNKSLIEEFDMRKPAYFEMRKRWRATRALR
jgi:beta-glucuronidase